MMVAYVPVGISNHYYVINYGPKMMELDLVHQLSVNNNVLTLEK